MTPSEAGRQAVADWPPLADEQIDSAARIIAADIRDRTERAA
jgi:hypothetical protein